MNKKQLTWHNISPFDKNISSFTQAFFAEQRKVAYVWWNRLNNHGLDALIIVARQLRSNSHKP